MEPLLRFKVDENLPIEVAEHLRQAGHEAATVPEEQMGGASDDVIAAVCRREKRTLITLVDHERIARAELVATARLDGLYGQRWKAETVNSVIKRKFGDAIRSRLVVLQNREPAVKGWVYNLHR